MGHKVLLVLASLAATACGSDPMPPPAPSQEQLDPVVFDYKRSDVVFTCHGSTGLYVAENTYEEIIQAIFAVPNHPECEPS